MGNQSRVAVSYPSQVLITRLHVRLIHQGSSNKWRHAMSTGHAMSIGHAMSTGHTMSTQRRGGERRDGPLARPWTRIRSTSMLVDIHAYSSTAHARPLTNHSAVEEGTQKMPPPAMRLWVRPDHFGRCAMTMHTGSFTIDAHA